MADMVHLNGNKLCVIDTETTGLDPEIHEIIEICCVPLDSNIMPVGKPLHLYLTPDKPYTMSNVALKINRVSRVDVMKRGIDQMKGIDIFMDWFKKLELVNKKKITPLGHNYFFDKSFISKWLGSDLYNLLFDYHTRDTTIVANFANDRAYLRSEKFPYPKQNLQYLCSELKVENPQSHTALGDCFATAEVYRKMIQSGSLLT